MVTGKKRRLVILSEPTPRGGHPLLWGYGYETIRRFLGYRNVGSVRNAVAKKLFDPSDLDSIFAFQQQRRRRRKELRS